ncbi:MAG: hypothetical protein R3C44_18230 [Chloroflexota bacterium]
MTVETIPAALPSLETPLTYDDENAPRVSYPATQMIRLSGFILTTRSKALSPSP